MSCASNCYSDVEDGRGGRNRKHSEVTKRKAVLRPFSFHDEHRPRLLVREKSTIEKQSRGKRTRCQWLPAGTQKGLAYAGRGQCTFTPLESRRSSLAVRSSAPRQGYCTHQNLEADLRPVWRSHTEQRQVTQSCAAPAQLPVNMIIAAIGTGSAAGPLTTSHITNSVPCKVASTL